MTKKSKEVEKKEKRPEYNEDGVWIETEEEIRNWEDI